MTLRNLTAACASVAAALCALSVPVSPARADVEDRLFDFTDAYYLKNGVNPAAIGGRREARLPLAITDTPPTANQRNVRALLTLPAYDQSGGAWYFTVLGGLSGDSFTSDAAGQRARQIADRSPEYVFPQRAAADPFTLGLTRQSVVLDMRNGFFSNDPLGIWIHVWVDYTDRALNTADGRKALSDLARKNGVDRDGTPVIRSVSEIDNLYAKGYISKRIQPTNSPLRYAICPVVKDPTDGGIAPDQFLSFPAKPDGTPVEPTLLNNFLSLQKTGDWSH